MTNFTPNQPPPSTDGALLLPLVNADDCANRCGRPALQGSIFCSLDCRNEMHARIDAQFEAMMWQETA